MGRRKKKKKSSSGNKNTAAPSGVAKQSAKRESKKQEAGGRTDPPVSEPAGSVDPEDVEKESLKGVASQTPEGSSDSEKLEAALLERSPFTGKLEPYDAEAEGVEWEEMTLSREIPELLNRVRARKAAEEERNQAKVQVDPELSRENELESSKGAAVSDEPDPEPGKRSRSYLYALGAVVVIAVIVGVFAWPGFETRGVGAEERAPRDSKVESLSATVNVDVGSDDGAEGRRNPPSVVTEKAQPEGVEAEQEPAEIADEGETEELAGQGQLVDSGAREGEGAEEEREESSAQTRRDFKKGHPGGGREEPEVAVSKTNRAENRKSGEQKAKVEGIEQVQRAHEGVVETKQAAKKDKKRTAEKPQKSDEADRVAGLSDWKKELKRTTGWKNKVEFLRKYVNTHPRDDGAMAKLATMLMETRFTRKEAKKLAQRAVDINPDNATAWLVIGYVHQLDGDKEASRKAYRRCAECSGPAYYVTECRRLL